MPRQKLIIDADPGIGDAVAIALALCDPTLEVVALTACGGLVSGQQAFRNLQTIVSIVDPQLWPRIGWSESPQASPADSPALSKLLRGHGKHGLGDCEQIAAPLHQPTDSAKLIAEMIQQHPGEISILTLGPLTNILTAYERDGELFSELKQLIIMGGSIDAHGDMTAVAEFNIFANPEAAQAVLTSSANKTLIPLETSHQFEVSFDEYDQLGVDEFSRLGRLLVQTIPFALRTSRNQLGQEGIVLPEVLAVAAVSHPELFEQTPMTVNVELNGELTRGMTVFDRRGLPHWKDNIEALTEGDISAVKDYFLRLIAAAAVDE